jgi:hypothetical protein
MTDEREADGELDPGAYIGREPERATETLPDGVQPGDERVAAYGSQPGVPGEPADPVADPSAAAPADEEPLAADLDALPDYTDKPMQEPFAETWGDPPAEAGLVVDDPLREEAPADQGVAPAVPTPGDPGADPGDIPALGGPLPA